MVDYDMRVLGLDKGWLTIERRSGVKSMDRSTPTCRDNSRDENPVCMYVCVPIIFVGQNIIHLPLQMAVFDGLSRGACINPIMKLLQAQYHVNR